MTTREIDEKVHRWLPELWIGCASLDWCLPFVYA